MNGDPGGFDYSGVVAAPPSESEQQLTEMWSSALTQIQDIDPKAENWKIQTLPLARIKKIMKSEEFVMQELEKDRLREQGLEVDPNEKSGSKFMISLEAPILMSKASELLIQELTTRAWQHTERNRRRTLQRQDLHAAVGESEMYDFLIDIVPRLSTAAGMPNVPEAPPAMGMPSMQPSTVQQMLINNVDPNMMAAAAAAAQMPPSDMDLQQDMQNANYGYHQFYSQQQPGPPEQQGDIGNIDLQPQQQQVDGGNMAMQQPPPSWTDNDSV